MKTKPITDTMKRWADRLMFGPDRKAGLLRISSAAPIAIPLIFWASLLEQLLSPPKK